MPDDSEKKSRGSKERLNITVSKLTMDMISELRDSTDADSDSEVIRNCIRLGYSMLLASRSGADLVVEKDGERTKIEMFGHLSPAIKLAS